MKIERFEDLECWKEARVLVNMVYEAINSSEKFRKDYRLRDQITDASVSSMSNIAEGFSRHTNREFVQYLFISKSSATEVQSESYVALDQKYITQETFENIYNQAEKVSKLDSGLITYLLKNEKRYKNKKTTPTNSTNSINSTNSRNSRNLINSTNSRNPMNSTNVLCCLLFALCSLLFALSSEAKVTGNCSNCHTMHNSQGGQPMAWKFSTGSFLPEATPYIQLLKSDCIGCHTATDKSTWKSSIGAPIIYNTIAPNYGDFQSDNKHIGLAAGNFYWTTGLSGASTSTSRGHSIPGISGDKPGYPGSSSFPCGDCHEGLGQGCKSCHLPAHHKGGASTAIVDNEDGCYRFLGPIREAAGGSDSHQWGVRGYEDPDWQKTYSSNDHNEYSGEAKAAPYFSISHFCAGCHYYTDWDGTCKMFVLGWTTLPFPPYPVVPSKYHQATLALPDESAKFYYFGETGTGGYYPAVPIARTNISTFNMSDTGTVSWGAGQTRDALMCLTCHRAHASPYDKMLRWDNTVALDQYRGCRVCHSSDPLQPP